MAIAGHGAMACLMGEEARVHTQKRQHGKGEHAHGEVWAGQQDSVRGDVPGQDECAIHGALHQSGPEATRIREIGDQHSVKAIVVQLMFSIR